MVNSKRQSVIKKINPFTDYRLPVTSLIFVTKYLKTIKLCRNFADFRIVKVITRYCVMINNLKDNKIILEIKELISEIDSAKNEINIYCSLMKQIFLSKSGKN